jgi:hypothetical protein
MRLKHHALVAQLDRASDYESGGRTFESCRARHKLGRKIGVLEIMLDYVEPRFLSYCSQTAA